MISRMLADRMAQLGGEAAFEILQDIHRLQEQGRTIIGLNIGEPDFDTPAHIVESATRHLHSGATHYTPSPGLAEVRRTVAQYISQTRGIPVDWHQVTIFPGAKPAIFLSMLAVLNPGDEVIYPDPGYPTYASVANFVGAKTVPLPLYESKGFRFEIAELAARITGRTKLIVLNSPQNPTGGILTAEDLQALRDLVLAQPDCLVLSDEIYRQIAYGLAVPSIVSLPGMAERTILLDGWSKAYAMTGWRLGFTVTPLDLAKGLGLLMTNSNSCAAAFTQLAGAEALMGDHAPIQAMVEEFRARRDLLVAGLRAIGIPCHLPEGAFYVFPNVSRFGVKSRAIQDYLLFGASEQGIQVNGVDGVAALAGTAFGAQGEGYLRLSYATSRENLERALAFLAEAFAQLPKHLPAPQASPVTV